MIGLSSLYPWLVVVVLGPRASGACGRRLSDGQVLAGDRPHLSKHSRSSCRSRSSRSTGVNRSSSRPTTASACAAAYLRSRTRRAGRRDRLLPRIPERPLELSAVPRPSPRPGVTDLFTFDFRNHGTSDLDPDYAPLQWTTEREIRDLRGALAYLRTRDDHDPAGFGLFGVSRGGTTALIVAAGEPDVWGVVTDGAFPDSGNDGQLHASLGRDLRAECLSARLDTDVALRLPGLDAAGAGPSGR